ncbi:MAG: endoribonuclease MazF [Planctomycetota bacterium]|nr:endoribonuclease MazF [Planctomycetota bacterium]
MKRRAYIPDRGDFVWVSLQPTAGHEQSGRRPALVVSPKSYNRRTGLCILCPATRQQKGYAFEVEVSNPDGTSSVVLSDHLRNIDWRARKVELIHRVPDPVLASVVARIEALIVSPDV